MRYDIPESCYWKSLKVQYGSLQLKICSPCQKNLFQNKDKVTRNDDGRYRIAFTLCERCFKGNVAITNVAANYF